MTTPGIHFLDASGPQGMRIYAIGDVHGRLDLLEAMHKAIVAELQREQPADWRIVHLGDYIDRGPASKSVLDFLVAASKRDQRNVMLAGNHDISFVDFLDQPKQDGTFMLYGGVQTAQSYGINLDRKKLLENANQAFTANHAALVAAVPPTHVAFLRSLPLSVVFGDFFFCHAGIRPGIALEEQVRDDLIWIRGEFHACADLYPKVIVHGHTPVFDAEVMSNRVNIDTGAYQSGRLTALAIDGSRKRLLTATTDKGFSEMLL